MGETPLNHHQIGPMSTTSLPALIAVSAPGQPTGFKTFSASKAVAYKSDVQETYKNSVEGPVAT